ncbi:MAG: AlkA N-terminal domain-containing protein [Blastocatellia bacterium]
MLFDHDSCYQALLTHDTRFDGVIFVGVTTTGIYCRPVCPARTPRRERCRFYGTAAAAESEGFRPCLRCRPELAPGNALVDAAARIAGSAAARIEAGALNEASVEELAREFDLSSRQLRRVMKSALGVTPMELAQTQRLLLAKRLLTDSSLPATEVAFASGFSSVRQFNAVFHERYGLRPMDLRRRPELPRETQSLTVDLAYRPPFDWPSMVEFLSGRAIPGIEKIEAGRYLRTVAIGEHRGWIEAFPAPEKDALRLNVSLSLSRAMLPLLNRVRSLFDLDAHPRRIEAHLARDARLKPLVESRPGLRVPGAFDPFEMMVRAVLGQQVSVRAATTLAGRLARAFSEPVETPHDGLTLLPARADRLAGASLEDMTSLGLTKSRAHCLLMLARAVHKGQFPMQAGAAVTNIDATIERMKMLPGIGEWTAQYIAMRALRWPDAFPAADLGVRKALGFPTVKQTLEMAESWRPWRAYAVFHLWKTLG